MNAQVLLAIAITASLVLSAHSYECVKSKTCGMKIFRGCKPVSGGLCRCVERLCCRDPFKFHKLSSCLASRSTSQAVRARDPCKKQPCKNAGYCVQRASTAGPKYRCDCSNTGFYGERCVKRCPRFLGKAIQKLLRKKGKYRSELLALQACVRI